MLCVGYLWAQKPGTQDWPDLARYRADNEALPAAASDTQRVVFFGDSITDFWGRSPTTGVFFPGKPYVNRGISGQTTPQMLVRFQQDVVLPGLSSDGVHPIAKGYAVMAPLAERAIAQALGH